MLLGDLLIKEDDLFTVKIYLLYFAKFLKSRLEYKTNFVVAVVANIFTTLAGLLFVVFLIDGKAVPSIKGWSREQILFIYGYSMMSMAVFSMFAPNLYGFSDRYIIKGEFDRVLLRPLNTICQVLFESFNLESIGSFIVGISVIFYSSRKMSLIFGPVDIIWLIITALAGGVILLSVFVILASVSFHFEDKLGISPPFYNMISFGRYPTSIYSKWLRFFLKWIVPFAFVAFYPANYFLKGPESSWLSYMSPIIAIVFATIANLMWRLGVSKYASTGS